jgi:Rrf2 family protein
MKISTRARYGTRLMVALGAHYGQRPVFLKEIAKAEEISEKYLSQIIMPLKAAGLVNSFRGAHGGYVLSRTPAQISLKDIVGALEGDFNLVGCLGNP